MDEEVAIANGLAASATTRFEMGMTPDQVRAELRALWVGLGSPDGAFRAAAEAVSRQPQPLVESSEMTERMRAIREMLGVQSAEAQLLAAISAREILLELAEVEG